MNIDVNLEPKKKKYREWSGGRETATQARASSGWRGLRGFGRGLAVLAAR